MNPNTKKLDGKVAVVTGASKGIGAGIAKHLAAAGGAVVVNYSSSKEGADKVVDEITKRGGKAIAVQADVAKKKDIERLFAETKKAFGQLGILVNNAGVYEFSPLENVTEEHFHKHFDVNVLGLLLTSQAALKYFGPDGGSVINISSGASTLTPPKASSRPDSTRAISGNNWNRRLRLAASDKQRISRLPLSFSPLRIPLGLLAKRW